MNITEAIQSRRSIRNFKNTPVPEDLLRRLADAGRLAPSASNLQAWKFFFVTEPDLVAKVDMFSPGLSGHPPVILVICSDMEYALNHSRNAEIYGCMMDASMAAENIMLAALEEGLGHLRHQVLHRCRRAQTPLSPRYIPHRNANVHRLP